MLTVLSGPDSTEAIAVMRLVATSDTSVLLSPPAVEERTPVEHQIMAVARAHKLEAPPALVDFLLDVLDADDLLPRLPYPFSRGELQIAGLLLAFAQPFTSLILDDPTGGLDATRRQVVADFIIDLAEDHEVICATDDPLLLHPSRPDRESR